MKTIQFTFKNKLNRMQEDILISYFQNIKEKLVNMINLQMGYLNKMPRFLRSNYNNFLLTKLEIMKNNIDTLIELRKINEEDNVYYFNINDEMYFKVNLPMNQSIDICNKIFDRIEKDKKEICSNVGILEEDLKIEKF